MRYIKAELANKLRTLTRVELDEIHERLIAEVKHERKTALWAYLYVTVLALSMLASIYQLCRV